LPIQSLESLPDGTTLVTDIVIVGGGACGLTIARALSGGGLRVLVIESGGLAEDAAHEALNSVEVPEGCWQQAEFDQRDRYHRNLTTLWDGRVQAYGVRCRGLGGSTQAWAGKSAPFSPIDLAPRAWVPLSGWPFGFDDLAPYVDRASDLLNLGPGDYDGRFWQDLGRRPPDPALPDAVLQSTFWKFARSRRNVTDIMRLGADFLHDPPPGVDVLTEATVTSLHSTPDGRAFTGLAAQSLSGRRLTVQARACVLSASAIENARLLLLSRDVHPGGLGNTHDMVGRCLMDHPTSTIARALPDQMAYMAARFGLYGFRSQGQTYVRMHGLALSDAWQRAERALNGAVFVTEERAPDDPFAALRRLLRRRSAAPLADILSVARSPVRIARGVAARVVERGYLPAPVSRMAVDVALRLFPNTVAQDFQSGRLPLKLAGVRFEATTEQPPDPDNRVTLSDRVDVLGLPMARVNWTPGTAARENLLRIGQCLTDGFAAAGLPAPTPEDWVIARDPQAAIVMDLGHSMGTTRMAASPHKGVVDADCAVHGVAGLFVAGGSVLPTSGHANPTLMILALALRLADHLRRKIC
jgi:choline dehydrogenase-like flavoprotein